MGCRQSGLDPRGSQSKGLRIDKDREVRFLVRVRGLRADGSRDDGL